MCYANGIWNVDLISSRLFDFFVDHEQVVSVRSSSIHRREKTLYPMLFDVLYCIYGQLQYLFFAFLYRILNLNIRGWNESVYYVYIAIKACIDIWFIYPC